MGVSEEGWVSAREGSWELCLPSLSSEAMCEGLGSDCVLILITKS